MQDERHFLIAARYVERNPLRAKLVAPGRAQDWPWSSLAVRRLRGRDRGATAIERQAVLSPWPVAGSKISRSSLRSEAGVMARWREPAGWVRTVNRPQSQAASLACTPSLRWVRTVNRPQSQDELDALRLSVQRGRPFGEAQWVEQTVAKLGLASTLRPRGRPRKVNGQAG